MNKAIVPIGFATLLFFAYCWQQRKNNSPKVYYKKKLPGGHNGMTLPPFGIFIVENEKNNKNLLEHELVHWRQFQREGLFPFVFNYTKENLKKGYDKNK